MSTQIDELTTTLADMQALLDDAPAHMRAVLEQHIGWARDTLFLFGSDAPTVPDLPQWTEHEQGMADLQTSAQELGRLPDRMRHPFVDRRAATGGARKKWT